MWLVSGMSVLIHLLIVVKAIHFFRVIGACRESDKHSVAAIATLSAMFVSTQVLVWMEAPVRAFTTTTFSGPMTMAYNFAVAVLFLGQIQLVTAKREDHV